MTYKNASPAPRRPGGIAWAAALVVALGFGLQAGAQTRPPARSAYEQMDNQALAEALRQFQMTQLLEQLASESGGAEARRLRAAALVSDALSQTAVQEHGRRMDEAVAIYREIVANSRNATVPSEVMQHYRDALSLADTLGRLRIQGAATRLMYLIGGPADAEQVRQHTDEAVRVLLDINDGMDEHLMSWRPDLRMQMTIVPQMEDLQQLVRYRTAWIKYYAALAQDDARARRRLLRDVVFYGEQFAQGDEGSGVKHWSTLLVGMARRELGEHEEAMALLQSVSREPAEPQVRLQALFELARAQADLSVLRVREGLDLRQRGNTSAGDQRIAQGREQMQRVRPAIGAFQQQAPRLVDEAQRVQIDIYATVLANYAMETWADAIEPVAADEARGARRAAQEVLIAFLDAHTDPGVQQAFYEIIGARYRGRTDYVNLSSVVLLAMASGSARGNPAELDEARRLLQIALERDDPISVRVRPMVLWQQGVVLNRSRLNREAADTWLRLAREYPQDRMALTAVQAACQTYRQLLQDWEGEPPMQLREEFVAAMRVLLGREEWESQDRRWWFDMGWQLERLGRYAETQEQQLATWREAVAAYQRVPEDQEVYLQALYQQLELRGSLLLEGTPDRQVAARLVTELERFSREAPGRAASLDESRREAVRLYAVRLTFLRAVLLHDLLESQDAGTQIVRQLRTDHEGTAIGRQANEFLIRKFVERGHVDTAIAELEQFRQAYPEEAGQLTQLVVYQIREEIRRLERNPARQDALANYRTVYHQFANELWRRAQASESDPQRLYAVKQLYADAVVQSGQAQEALALFTSLVEQEEARRQPQLEAIDRDYAGRIERARSAGRRSVSALEAEVQSFDARLRELSLPVERFPQAVLMSDAMADLRRATDERRQAELRTGVATWLAQALEQVREVHRTMVPRDHANLIGLARAHRQLGQYDLSEEYYQQLVRGLSPVAHADLFWQAELEYARMALEAHGDNRDRMRRLAAYIAQRRAQYENMGGRWNEFVVVLRQARRQAGLPEGG